MDMVIVSRNTVKFNFSLKELMENYRRYLLYVPGMEYPTGQYLCCWIPVMCIENFSMKPKVGGIDLRWDMFDIDVTSNQVMNQWIDQINPYGNKESNTLFPEWNSGTDYSINSLEYDYNMDSISYRLKCLEIAFGLNPDVQFQIYLRLDAEMEFDVSV